MFTFSKENSSISVTTISSVRLSKQGENSQSQTTDFFKLSLAQNQETA